MAHSVLTQLINIQHEEEHHQIIINIFIISLW